MWSRSRWASLVVALSCACGGGGSSPPVDDTGPPDAAPDVTPTDSAPPLDADAPGPSLPDAGDWRVEPLDLVRVEPSHGPFTGGNLAVLRGSGLDPARLGPGCVSDCGRVLFGDAVARVLAVPDSHRVEVEVPPGARGRVDVTVDLGASAATLSPGYAYDALQVVPSSGPIQGLARVSLRAAADAFDDTSTVTFGGAPCLDPIVVGPRELECTTSPWDAGVVGVSVEDAMGLVAWVPEAYTYVDPVNVARATGGGPIDGALYVTVVEGVAGNPPLADAFVMLGNDVAGPLAGRTDAHGRITFAAPGLRGPVDLHAAAPCFEAQSILGFDARYVTLSLNPLRDGADCFPAPMPPGRRLGEISGRLLFPGAASDAKFPGVPTPGEGERQIAHVLTTRVAAAQENPDPLLLGGTASVTPEYFDEGGYAYSIASRFGGLAVVALAGVVDDRSGIFRPSVMGVARGITITTTSEVDGVDIVMDIPLEESLAVKLADAPPPRPTVVTYTAHAYLVVGEGALVLQVWGGSPLGLVSGDDPESLLVPFLPRLEGVLADARLEVEVLVRDMLGGGRSQRWLRRLGPTTEVTVEGVLGFPQILAPAAGAPFPADRLVRWQADGPEPDVVFVGVSDTARQRWTVLAPGDRDKIELPDLGSVPGLEGVLPASGSLNVVTLARAGFTLDDFSFQGLNVGADAQAAVGVGWSTP